MVSGGAQCGVDWIHSLGKITWWEHVMDEVLNSLRTGGGKGSGHDMFSSSCPQGATSFSETLVPTFCLLPCVWFCYELTKGLIYYVRTLRIQPLPRNSAACNHIYTRNLGEQCHSSDNLRACVLSMHTGVSSPRSTMLRVSCFYSILGCICLAALGIKGTLSWPQYAFIILGRSLKWKPYVK